MADLQQVRDAARSLQRWQHLLPVQFHPDVKLIVDYLDSELNRLKIAPRWALCSDCRLQDLPTCPQDSKCWDPIPTSELPAEQP